MDVDAIRKVTEADKERYLKEGRCFECRKQGHMARKCPIRLRKKGKWPQRAQVKVLDVPEIPEVPKEKQETYTPQGIIEALKAMGEDQLEGMRKLYEGDKGFVDA
jgi:hypothetical protein